MALEKQKQTAVDDEYAESRRAEPQPDDRGRSRGEQLEVPVHHELPQKVTHFVM